MKPSIFGARDVRAAKLREARKQYHRRYVKDRSAQDYSDPIYREAILESQRATYAARRALA